MGQLDFNEHPKMDRSFEFVRGRCPGAFLHQIFIVVFIVRLNTLDTCVVCWLRQLRLGSKLRRIHRRISSLNYEQRGRKVI
jgi:hypothetical protein